MVGGISITRHVESYFDERRIQQNEARYNAAVTEAIGLAEVTGAEDLYDCEPLGFSIKPSSHGPTVLLKVSLQETDVAKSGYFAKGGQEVVAGKPPVEAQWVLNGGVNEIAVINPDGTQTTIPSAREHLRIGNYPEGSHTYQISVPIGSGLPMRKAGEDRIKTVGPSVQYVSVGDRLVMNDIPITTAACAGVRYHIDKNGNRTVIGVTDMDGNPLKVTE